jgi:membrane protease YdiL (CAAX protease family)
MFLLFLLGSAVSGIAGIFFTQIVIFFGVAVGFAVYYEKRPVAEVFRLRPLGARGYARSLLLGVIVWAMLFAMGSVITRVIELTGGKIPAMYTDLATSSFALALITRALLPAICEEMAFRGYLQWSLGPLGATVATVGTGLLFGAMHFTVIRVIPLALLGWLFAVAVQRSGSILPGMIMHFLNNAVNLFLAYFAKVPEEWTRSPLALVGLLAASVVLARVGWKVAQGFSQADLAGGVEAVEAARDERPPAPRAALGQLVVPLLPGLMIYLYGVLGELYMTYWAS